jgi:hypothetical protein
MPAKALRASMWEEDGRWHARLEGAAKGRTFSAATKAACVAALRRAAGKNPTLTIEVTPALAGVAEAAAIMGWDKRRVVTYLDRGAFPKPFASLASGRVWWRSDVEAYAKKWAARRHARPPRERTS